MEPKVKNISTEKLMYFPGKIKIERKTDKKVKIMASKKIKTGFFLNLNLFVKNSKTITIINKKQYKNISNNNYIRYLNNIYFQKSILNRIF